MERNLIRDQWPNPYADGAPLEAFDGWRGNPRDRYICRPCIDALPDKRRFAATLKDLDGLGCFILPDHPARCDHCNTWHIEGEEFPVTCYVYRLAEPTIPDHERPTDPSPPPESDPAPNGTCLDCGCPHPCECSIEGPPHDPVGGFTVALSENPWPTSGPLVSIEPGAFKVVNGEVVPATKQEAASRDWLDYGKDTGPRLRVRGFVDAKEAIPTIEPEPTYDPRDVDEIHEASEKAFREGDDHALGKIYEDLLDDMHSGRKTEAEFWTLMSAAADELSAALTAELREVARAEPNWGWKHKLDEHGIKIRARTPQGEQYECQLDAKSAQNLIKQALRDPKGAAVECITRARDQIKDARVRSMLGGHVPTVPERAQA